MTTQREPIITRKDAKRLLRQALVADLGVLCWASDIHEFRTALYRARGDDPSLQSLQFRLVEENEETLVAVVHPPHSQLTDLERDPSRSDARRTSKDDPDVPED